MKPIIAANWKMNFTPEESLRLIDDITSQGLPSDVDIIFFPSFLDIHFPREPASVSSIFSKTIFLFFLPNSN